MNSDSSRNHSKRISQLRPGQSQALTRAELGLLRQKVVDLAQKRPEKAAILLTEWIKQPAQRRTAKKTG